MMIYGQTRMFFVMSRDGLLPAVFSKIHSRYRTPHIVTIVTGVFVALFAALFPIGVLADVSNAGTLFAFTAVAIAVLILRRKDPNRIRPFRTPATVILAPLAIVGCLFLFVSLSTATMLLFAGWSLIGFIVYFWYGYRSSNMAHASEGAQPKSCQTEAP
jgi:APA family basic amino acid/polyamine antiporter